MPEPAEQLPDRQSATWGLVCALKIEITPVLARLDHARTVTGGKFTFRGGKFLGGRLAIVEAGSGAKRAQRATQALIDAHSPRWVLSVGFSGALLPEMKIGDIVVANGLRSLNSSETLMLDLHMAPDPERGLHVGKLLMTDHIVRTVDEKKQLHTATGAIAVDMESLSVARVCQEQKVKFMAVRVISDDLSADLPPEILSLLGSKGTIRAGAVAGALWNRPSSLFDMLNLRERANSAAEHLAQFLEGVLRTLATA